MWRRLSPRHGRSGASKDIRNTRRTAWPRGCGHQGRWCRGANKAGLHGIVALGGVMLCWATASPLAAAIQDVRLEMAQESLRYMAGHPADLSAPKHRWRKGFQLDLRQQKAEVPGGIGFGYYFNDTALLWTNSTILDYYIIAPSHAGGDMDYLLYLTSTCRSQLGTESLVSYRGQNEARFWVYDWAVMQGNQFQADQLQVNINLPTVHPEYLATRFDEFANSRQMCHVRNGTYYLDSTSGMCHWQNRVLLFNFKRADWDLIYSHNYASTNLTDNLFPGSDPASARAGSWGPVIEEFLDSGTYHNLNVIGFDLVRLFQDGNPHPWWLTPSNSYALQSTPFLVITEAPNTCFAAYTGPKSGPDVFQIASISRDLVSTQASIGLHSWPGRDYVLYTAPTPAGSWSQIGPPLTGNGANIDFKVPTLLAAASFRVGRFYNTGTLCVTANTNTASFSLSPATGLVSPYWVATPNGDRWDKTVVGLPPGTYTITFNAAPPSPAPPPQILTVSSNTIATVEVTYLP